MTKGVFPAPLVAELTGRLKQGRPVWRLYRALVYITATGEDLTVPEGFETDYASVPRAFWRLAPPGGLYAAAATLHDYLYVNRIGERKAADDLFLEAMEAAGVGWPQRSIIYRAVRMFGWKGWGK